MGTNTKAIILKKLNCTLNTGQTE